MEQQEKLLKLILDSVTINDRLSGEAIEIFIERAFALSEEEQAKLIALLEREKEKMMVAAEKNKMLIEEFYKKLKEIKVSAKKGLLVEAEKEDRTKAGSVCEGLLAGV